MGNTLPTTPTGWTERYSFQVYAAALKEEDAERVWNSHAQDRASVSRDEIPDLFLSASKRLVEELLSANAVSLVEAQARLGGPRFSSEFAKFRSALENSMVSGASVSRFLRATKYTEAAGLAKDQFVEAVTAGARLTQTNDWAWAALAPKGPDGKRRPALPSGPRPGSGKAAAAPSPSEVAAATAPDKDAAPAAQPSAGAAEAPAEPEPEPEPGPEPEPALDPSLESSPAEVEKSRRTSVMLAIRKEDDVQRRASQIQVAGVEVTSAPRHADDSGHDETDGEDGEDGASDAAAAHEEASDAAAAHEEAAPLAVAAAVPADGLNSSSVTSSGN